MHRRLLRVSLRWRRMMMMIESHEREREEGVRSITAPSAANHSLASRPLLDPETLIATPRASRVEFATFHFNLLSHLTTF